MNKFKLLVAPLLVIPFIAACNNGGGDKPAEVKFSLSSDWPIEVLDNKTAKVYVDWTPDDNIIRFESFTFTASPAKENKVTFEQTGDPRPMPVTITFKEDITTDISGTLSFAYEDVTAKTKGNSSIDVTISVPPAPPSVLPTKCSYYNIFEGDIYLTVVELYEYNDKGLMTKKISQYSEDIKQIDEYEYDDKNNVIKDTYTYEVEGEIDDTYDITYTYIYDEKDRITKMTKHKDVGSTPDYIDEYTYESDTTIWKTYKHSDDGGASYENNITRTFEDGLYIKSVDSIRNEYCYYTWDEHKCNTRVETYEAEEKILDNLYCDEAREYHKNRSDQMSKNVALRYVRGELFDTQTTLVDYDGYDRQIRMSFYYEGALNNYFEYEYAD